MDEIKQRLEDTSAACVKTFVAWRGDEKNNEARTELQEAIHELRKVASRLEIELAVSDRNNNTSKPIPIPSHRSHGRSAQGSNEGTGGDSKDEAAARKSVRSGMNRKKPAPKKAADGNS